MHIIRESVCLIVFSSVVYSLHFIKENLEKPSLQVQTASGTVQGIRLKSEASQSGYYYAYMGIPYAEPPIGYLRFRAPKWAENWSGVLDGTREGKGCVEIQLRTKRSRVIGSEDCLFINVFTRNNPKKVKRLIPVMVFIYGGAYIEGNSEFSSNGPDLLVSKDVVVITFNYRVGPFGFLSTQDMASPGNYGLKDQNLALQWVKKNIRKFGGDPDNVALFGASAGSASINFHLLSPKSKGLFHRAILISGTVLCHWGCQRKPLNVAVSLGLANGITQPKDNQELIDELRKIPIEDLKQSLLGNILVTSTTLTLFGIPYAPSIEPEHEDAFLSKDFWFDMMNMGEFNRIPILMGVTSNESIFFHSVINMIRPLFYAYHLDRSFLTPPAMNISDMDVSIKVGNLVEQHYFGLDKLMATANLENLCKYITHDFFTRPIRKSAMLMAKYVPLYLYYFSYEGDLGAKGIDIEAQHPGIKGVAHTEDLFYIINKIGVSSQKITDNLVRNRMLSLLTNFAKFGNPTPNKQELLNNIIWPTVSPSSLDDRLQYLEINETLTVRNEFNEQIHLDWWENLFKKYANPPLRTY